MIEESLQRATLWIACRHHIYKFHIKHVCETITGTTKDPGAKLFRRLKTMWNRWSINKNNLTTFDYSSANKELSDQARSVKNWALKNSTFEIGGYKELLELMIIWLGGHIHKFSFKVPGAS